MIAAIPTAQRKKPPGANRTALTMRQDWSTGHAAVKPFMEERFDTTRAEICQKRNQPG